MFITARVAASSRRIASRHPVEAAVLRIGVELPVEVFLDFPVIGVGFPDFP